MDMTDLAPKTLEGKTHLPTSSQRHSTMIVHSTRHDVKGFGQAGGPQLSREALHA